MARTNVAVSTPRKKTHEGTVVPNITSVQQLRRSVMACMLFEDTFYESGVEIATRIQTEVMNVLKLPNGADIVANIAYEARTKFKLRHAPLWLVIGLISAKTDAARAVVSGVIASVVQRPDELAELVAMYWKKGKQPLTNQMKKGLAAAFTKFDRYSLSKYANREAKVQLRDVLFLSHAKPVNEEQDKLWKELKDKKLTAPDTWEVNLSAGQDKKLTFTRLLEENKLGPLALLRNLRNMQTAGVSDALIAKGLAYMNTERVLPFRFITAARYAPKLEDALEKAMFRCLGGVPKLKGKTVLVVDNSGSMVGTPVSAKSELDRRDAACALAMLLREICEDCQIVVFGSTAGLIRPRRGFALRDQIRTSQHSGGTNTDVALQVAAKEGYTRCIVLTDEQSHTSIPNPVQGAVGYFINVASYKNGIGYGKWTHIDGFSEAVIDFIQQHEQQGELEAIPV